ncbi:MAG TPA: glycoside hydrolase TIM-barrel-like domain-containing protein, partial [Planctomycetaceae bacterium]
NLITYSADWSDWMGYQHPTENGQWPHLDSLYASNAIDFVSLDNYMPLSDWTTGGGGLDAINWQSPPPALWPTSTPERRGFGLGGAPIICSTAYLSANIEGGEKFDWYYDDSVNAGAGADPNGSGLFVSIPQGDRVSQTREAYSSAQQILGNKQLRWWWNNRHYALYDAGGGWIAQGPQTEWVPNSKPILFLEYGIPAVDKGTNQPNLFYSVSSVQSGTPYWSTWQGSDGGGLTPVRDDTIAEIALDAQYEYWQANNASSGGVAMIEWAFCCVWNWDARPFPTFPELTQIWGDAENWAYGNWQAQGRLPLPPVAPSPDPTPATYPTFPTLATLGWSVRVTPKFLTGIASHVSGRESRMPARAYAYRDIELTYELLRAGAANEFETIAGFYTEVAGRYEAFWFAPPGLSALTGQALGTGNGVQTVFPLVSGTENPVEPVQATSGVSAVYLDSALQAAGWSVSSGYSPTITFATAPNADVAVTADFGVLWLCRFAEDVADFENFMALLWSFRSVKLQTTRP